MIRFRSLLLMGLLTPLLAVGMLHAGEPGIDDLLPPPAPPGAEEGTDLLLPPPLPEDDNLLEPPTSPPTEDESEAGVPPLPPLSPEGSTLPAPPLPVDPPQPGVLGGEMEGMGSTEPTDLSSGVPGKIINGSVNIRVGPSSDTFDSIVTLGSGTAVTVFDTKGDWVQIAYPDGQFCHIHQKYIQGEIPASIPEQGLVRSLQGGPVSVRAKPWISERNRVMQMDSGTVVVKALRGQFAQVVPPANARAWVFGKYIDFPGKKSAESSTTTTVTDAGQPTSDGATPKMPDSERDAAIRAKQKERYDKALAKIRARRAARMRLFDQAEEELARIEREKEARLKEIAAQGIREAEEARNRRNAAAATATPPPPPGTLDGHSGYIERQPQMGGRPTEYRLIKGQDVIFLLRSNTYDLSLYRGKHVIVNGPVVMAPGWEANIMDVNYIRYFNRETPEPASSYDIPDPRMAPITTMPPVETYVEEESVIIQPAAPEAYSGDPYTPRY